MVFHRIRRTAAWAGLLGALALVAPAGTASAKTHGQPTPLTITPKLAETTAVAPSPSASLAEAGVIEVAQTATQRRRQRAADRRQFRRQRAADRRQFRRQRTADRRQVRRQRTADRRRVYRNGRWYYYRDDGYYYDSTGAALAAGAIGLAAGAIAGSALAAPPRVVYQDDYVGGVPAPYTAEWYRQCDLKYNSFRASDGTYLGYDGRRHTCRLP